MKYVMLAVVATIGAVALSTIAGAFLWAISDELEDLRDLLHITLADAIRWVHAANEISGLEDTHISEPTGDLTEVLIGPNPTPEPKLAPLV